MPDQLPALPERLESNCDSLRMVVSGTTLGLLTAFRLAQNFHHRQIEISMTVNQSPTEKRPGKGSAVSYEAYPAGYV